MSLSLKLSKPATPLDERHAERGKSFAMWLSSSGVPHWVTLARICLVVVVEVGGGGFSCLCRPYSFS